MAVPHTKVLSLLIIFVLFLQLFIGLKLVFSLPHSKIRRSVEAQAMTLTVAVLTCTVGIQLYLLPNCVDDYCKNLVNMIFFPFLKHRYYIP